MAVNLIDTTGKKKYSYSMSEVHVGQFPKGGLSRRDFLKVTGTAAGSLLLAACGIKTPEGTGSVEYREVLDGQTVNLILPGEMNPTPVVIQYPQHGLDFTPLEIRQDKGHDTFQPFEDGTRRTRMMGELVTQQVFAVAPNPKLEGVDIHTYPSAITDINAQGMSVLPAHQIFHALSVITVPTDYIGDRQQPVELNGHPIGSRPVESFGVGALLGGVSTVDGKPTFLAGMFIHDLRALVSAPAK